MKDYLKELKQFLKLGIPIYGSQASYAAMGLTDTIVAGRAGAVELSGVAIGSSVANPLFFALSGLMFAITPIVAHLFGANRLKDISLKMKEVIWIAMGVGIILTLAYPLAGSLLRFSSIDKEIKGHKKNKSELSSIVAETLAKKAIEKNGCNKNKKGLNTNGNLPLWC